ncbi:MAG: hypothetical protein R8K22_05880 [Mariprofundaceae bacterium]
MTELTELIISTLLRLGADYGITEEFELLQSSVVLILLFIIREVSRSRQHLEHGMFLNGQLVEGKE